MILIGLSLLALVLAALFAAMIAVNLRVLRGPPPRDGAKPEISVLVPARDEAVNIGPALDATLASREVKFEVVVLDDDSTDGTAEIVKAHAARDGRVRLIRGAALPPGWNGKQHACWQLAQAARYPVLVFVDADVRLAPDALAGLAAFMDAHHLALASGFPRQITRSLAEQLVIPQILVLLLGYLPLPMARKRPEPGFAAGCGQLMAVRCDAYEAADGHRAIRASMHDGITLPRSVRAAGGRTDVLDATQLAACRMYEGWRSTWAGFAKNATEGMARPGAIWIWTGLLGGGHVLPLLLAVVAAAVGNGPALGVSLSAVALVYGARTALALRVRQSALSVLLHPLGVALVLAIQWWAFVAARQGRPAQWRGRRYDA